MAAFCRTYGGKLMYGLSLFTVQMERKGSERRDP